MPVFDDDDINDEVYPGSKAWSDDTNDNWDDPDERDVAPDELSTERCTNCRKWILEDSVRCPYCGEMQLESMRSRKPLWFVIAVVVCLVAMLLFFVFGFSGIVSGFHL